MEKLVPFMTAETTTVGILNNRTDRERRAVQFAEVAVQDLDFMRLVTFGAFEGLVTDLLVQNGYPLDHIINLGDTHSPPVETIVDRMIGQMPTSHVLVVGFVNIHTHQAEMMLDYFENIAEPVDAESRSRPTATRPVVHDYLFSSEIVRFAFVFGICVSMMLYERLHLTTGSIVVPGYIAVFLVYPMVVVATFVNALLSYALMNHVLRQHFMLYGRTKFTLMALISISIQTVMLKVSPSGPWLWESNIPLFVGAGYVVPALIAHDMGRQGIKRTTKAVLLAGVIVSLPIALALVLQLKGVNDLAPLAGFGTMSIANHWIPLAVLLSAAASWGVAQQLQPQVRRLRRRGVHRHVHG